MNKNKSYIESIMPIIKQHYMIINIHVFTIMVTDIYICYDS